MPIRLASVLTLCLIGYMANLLAGCGDQKLALSYTGSSLQIFPNSGKPIPPGFLKPGEDSDLASQTEDLLLCETSSGIGFANRSLSTQSGMPSVSGRLSEANAKTVGIDSNQILENLKNFRLSRPLLPKEQSLPLFAEAQLPDRTLLLKGEVRNQGKPEEFELVFQSPGGVLPIERLLQSVDAKTYRFHTFDDSITGNQLALFPDSDQFFVADLTTRKILENIQLSPKTFAAQSISRNGNWILFARMGSTQVTTPSRQGATIELWIFDRTNHELRQVPRLVEGSQQLNPIFASDDFFFWVEKKNGTTYLGGQSVAERRENGILLQLDFPIAWPATSSSLTTQSETQDETEGEVQSDVVSWYTVANGVFNRVDFDVQKRLVLSIDKIPLPESLTVITSRVLVEKKRGKTQKKIEAASTFSEAATTQIPVQFRDLIFSPESGHFYLTRLNQGGFLSFNFSQRIWLDHGVTSPAFACRNPVVVQVESP